MESTDIRDDKTYSNRINNSLAGIRNEGPLCLAVRNGELSSFSSLLRQGSPMTARVFELIFESWTNQGSEFCEAWLREGGNIDGFYDDSTPLKLALRHETCMLWLLEHGADPNAPPRPGYTVDLLAFTATLHPSSTVELLLLHGASVKGTLALHAAATLSGKMGLDGSFQSDVFLFDTLALLLKHGADPNGMEVDPKALGRPRPSYIGTPLHCAVSTGSVEAVQCLLSYGADVSAHSWSGLTAFDVAQKYGRKDMVDALQEHVDSSQCLRR